MIRLASGLGSSGTNLQPRVLDPRLSESQLATMQKIADQDPSAMIEGLDRRLRPVISANLPGPGRTRFALLRNGNMRPVRGDLEETWG